MRTRLLLPGIAVMGLLSCADRVPQPPPVDAPAADEAAAVAAAPDRAVAHPISYAGFGPARFGATQEEVRMAWGRDMVGGPGDPDGCYYLYPEPQARSAHRLAFMIENRQFARLDVDAAGIPAPGGGQVGMDADAIRRLYPDVQEHPHKYLEGGRVLRHVDAGGSVLVFELDARGKVIEWRLGVPPQVDYVEGCG